jgi:PAS domain S-box-containing protein
MEDMHIRRLVIMKHNTVCGIVTQTDIFQAVESKLQEEEERQRRLLEASTSCIFSTDLQGRITYVNPAYARLFGVAGPQDLVDQPFLADRFWHDPEERTAFLKTFQETGHETHELALQTAQGQDIYITIYSHFTTGAQGEINGKEGVICDITARKKAEAALDGSLSELLEKSRQAGRAEATAGIRQRIECAFDSVTAAALHINDMIAQSDLGPDISREFKHLTEEINHIKNIITA